MAVSVSPWWWSPEEVAGATWVWPIHTFEDPTVLPEIASRRVMPVVWRVSPLSSAPLMCRSGACQWSVMRISYTQSSTGRNEAGWTGRTGRDEAEQRRRRLGGRVGRQVGDGHAGEDLLGAGLNGAPHRGHAGRAGGAQGIGRGGAVPRQPFAG